MNPLRASIVASLLASPLLLAACGGLVSSSPSDGTKTDEPATPGTATEPASSSGGAPGSSTPNQPANPGEGAPQPKGTHAAPCLDPMPADGTACSSPGATCEYGGDTPATLCSTMVRCYGATDSSPTTWHVTPPDPSCVSQPSQDSPSCPATFGALMNGAACPLSGNECVYPEGVCSCTACYDGASQVADKQWTCVGFSGAADRCPNSRPDIGTACPTDGMTCSYGAPCELILDWYPMECKNGAWAVQAHGEDCAAPMCLAK
jgi:hypothetical protein